MDELLSCWSDLGYTFAPPDPPDERPWIAPDNHVYVALAGPKGEVGPRWLCPYVYDRSLTTTNTTTITLKALFREATGPIEGCGIYLTRDGGRLLFHKEFAPICLLPGDTFEMNYAIKGIAGDIFSDGKVSLVLASVARATSYDICGREADGSSG